MITSLLLGLGIVASAGSGELSRLQLSLSGNFAVSSNSSVAPMMPSTDANAFDGSAALEINVFLGRRLRDDDRPLSLQPFLQKVTTLRISGGGGGYSESLPPVSLATTALNSNGFGGIGVSAYVGRYLYLDASFDMHYDHFFYSPAGVAFSHTLLRLPASVGIGVRYKTLLVDAGYTPTAKLADTNWRQPYWGHGFVSARMVVRNFLDLSTSVSSIENGALANFSAGIYPTRRLGIYAGIGGGRGVVFDDDTRTCNRVYGHAGVTYWLSRHIGFDGSYTPTWTQCDAGINGFFNSEPPSFDQYTQVNHNLSFALLSRL